MPCDAVVSWIYEPIRRFGAKDRGKQQKAREARSDDTASRGVREWIALT